MRGFRITYNAPVILTFSILAALVHVIGGDGVTSEFKTYFVSWPDLNGFREYLGLFSHVLGHGNWAHLVGNFTMILLLGPILEERHGSGSLLIMIALTACVTGLINAIFFSNPLLGASGIVFMFILLASMVNIRSREIPLTFILVAVLYLGAEVRAAFRADNISQMGHLVGGFAGAVFGFINANMMGNGSVTPATSGNVGKAKQPASPATDKRDAAKIKEDLIAAKLAEIRASQAAATKKDV